MDKLLPQRSRSVFYASFVVSFAAIIVGAIVLALAARAATYSTSFASGSVNWTATTSSGTSLIWGCSTTGTNDTCGIYPGQLANPGGDTAIIATTSGGATIQVTSAIPNPVTLSLSAINTTLNIGSGGSLTLTGSSAVSPGSSPGSTLSLSGGTLTNNGTLDISGPSGAAGFNFISGTLAGTGTTNIGLGANDGTWTITGTGGPMAINQQTVNVTSGNGSVVNFNSPNPLTLNGSTINNQNTFNATSGTINGTGKIVNTGNFSSSSGGLTMTVASPFVNNGGTVNVTGSTLSLTGGSGVGNHSNATWNLTPSGPTFPATLEFGGFHSFIGTQTFTGTGTVHVLSGGGFTLSTPTITMPSTIDVANDGQLSFATAGDTLNVGGNYTQGASGTLAVFVGPFPTTDLLNISGNSSLAGTLLASATSPANGQIYTVMQTGGTRSGDFTTYALPTYPGGQFIHQYSGTGPEQLQLIAVPTDVDLSITKSGPATVAANGPLSYAVTVTNGGPASVGSLTVVDTLPAGVTGASASGSLWTCGPPSGGTITCTWPSTAVAPLTTGQSAPPITVVATAPGTAGTITNTATASSPANDPNLTNNTATATTTVTAVSDVSITKSGPATVIAGQNVVYTITVANAGPSAATGVVVSDPTPAGTTFVSNSGACTTPFPCNIASIPASSNVTITSTFKVASNATGSVSNAASVSSASSDPNGGNNIAPAVTTTVTSSADLGITKSLASTLTAGANATYSITVTNNGPSDATGVVVNDPTPAGMTFVSNTGACVTPFPCNLGTLVAGANATITTTYAVAPTATGTISNTATVTATTTDPTPGNNTATATGTIGTNSDLSITKTGPASANAGQTITYTINVVNNGPSTATGVVVTDPTPAQTTAGTVSGPCTSFPCNIGTMAPGASTTISATYTINAGATGSVTNTATVSSTSTDPIPTNNTASKTTTISAQADLQIIKTGPSGLPPGGGTIVFNIVVKNLGPGTATNLVVNDSPSAGLTFVSNSGACATPFPCTIASLAAGAQATIQSTFSVPANLQRASNTADVNSSTTPDPNPSNNTSSVNLGSSCPSGSIVQFSPFSGQADAPVAGLVQWTAVSNATYDVYLGPAGSGCTTLLASNVSGNSVAYSGLTPNTDYESRIVASRGSCPAISSQCIRWRTGAGPCSLAAPVIIAPAPGANVGSPLSLKWNAVAGANNYHVVVMNGATTVVDTTTPNTSLDVTVPNGAITWSVTALSDQNCTSPAANSSFNVCSAPEAPLAGVVGAPTSGRTYSVIVVDPSPNNVRYEFQEADNASFSNATTLTSSSPTESYTHTTSSAQVLFYRVRAFVGCTNTPGPYSKTIRVVIVPPQVNRINVPAGSKDLVVVQVQVPGEATPVNFTATSSRPWVVKIDPSNGILPAVQGLLLNVTIDPAQLPNGTFTSSIIITTSPLTSSGRLTTNGGNKSVPVTINLVTPVVPNNPSGPTADSLIIPAVGHLAGINSQWRSDIRIYNASPQTLSYLLNFTAQGSSDVKQTTITTASGDTTALDDIIHNWFGVGEVGDSSTGVLEIRPMLTDGTTTPPKGTTFTTVASSRTFSETSQGTVGQFIPPVKFTNFIGTGAKLSLQQLSQSNSYRTNFGLVEASGSPVSLTLSMFTSAGSKLFDLPVNLAAGEQKQLNGLLATQGVNNLTDGRMEVVVAGGNGKVTAYASVIDNQSSDPQLVPGQTIGGNSSRLYVVPGVADLNNGVAAWRTDMRVYNSGNAPQTANLTFFAQGNSTSPSFATFTVNPGEVKVLDNVLQSTFSTHDVGGMVQVTTPSDSQLVVTARTFNQTSNGTLGQFIKAATTADGITTNTRGLNILEVEDSPRFRTNLGLAEMSGRAATVEVSVILPDSKLTPTIQVPLAANEFRQFSVEQFGLGDIYNARVSVKVVDGQGSVTAYGSVIDQITTDPTYVQAQ